MDNVNNDIYSLIDTDDMSFVKIDEIALGMGTREDDDRRIKALIIYIMKGLCFNSITTKLINNSSSSNFSHWK